MTPVGKAYLVLSLDDIARIHRRARAMAREAGYTGKCAGRRCVLFDDIELNRDSSYNLQICSADFHEHMQFI